MTTGLKLHNTLTRTKDAFEPLDPANVRMYVCGPTVYDFAHIGNARPLIVFDVLFRLLRQLYGQPHVTYVRNVTDVDDKINARALAHWTRLQPLTHEIRDLTDTTLAQFREDVAALGCLPPTHEPRATDHIVCDDPALPEEKRRDMVSIVARLVARGHAYVADGHVLFDVPSMPAYGALAHRPKDEMIAGARVEVAPYKRDPMDFILWKPSDPETEPGWSSPWGYGRPGWHIECSAMSSRLLGDVFDIHAGGIDLIFPHHENEIAQSCCAFDTPLMATSWLHNGFLQVEGQKMSKSLGNFVTIRDVLRDWPGDVVRLAMLKTHYRQPIDWTLKALDEADKELSGWRRRLFNAGPSDPVLPQSVVAALSDDLNTHRAFSEMHRMRTLAGGFGDLDGPSQTKDGASALAGAMQFFGFALEARQAALDETVVEQHVAARVEARKARNFAESDRLRDALVAMGIEIRDGKDAATGEPTTEWELRR